MIDVPRHYMQYQLLKRESKSRDRDEKMYEVSQIGSICRIDRIDWIDRIDRFK
jgi:hypothetical protein